MNLRRRSIQKSPPRIVSIIRELAETGITQVIVTHEVEVARKTASRVVYMEKQPYR